MNAEIFLKLAIIFLMSVFVSMIALSALLMFEEEYAQSALIVHRSIGIVFLLILPVHIYLRKHKLKKMISDLILTLKSHESIQECDNHKLLKTLKSRSLKEICDSLKISIDMAIVLLNEKSIIINSAEESLERIAQQSSYDALKIVAMILENQIRMMKNNQ